MTKTKRLKFRMFADCIPVKGYKRSIIYDLNRQVYKFIPNSMADFIEFSTGKSENEIKSCYKKELHSTIDEYFYFLKENDFGFWIDERVVGNFQPLDLSWHYPAEISNAIIDLDADTDFDLKNIMIQLEDLGCKHLQIRAYHFRSMDFYSDLLAAFSSSGYLSIEIITPFHDKEDKRVIRKFIEINKRISAIIFHSAPINKITNSTGNYMMGNVAYTKQMIKSPQDCVNNPKYFFSTSVQLFCESQKHNTYYNRKICIDSAGNIKNSPEIIKKFGNVKSTELRNVIVSEDFKTLWFVHKEMIDVCKDCEFRHMCVDSCVPLKRDDNSWYRSNECNYNPYLCKWEGEIGYQSNQTLI